MADILTFSNFAKTALSSALAESGAEVYAYDPSLFPAGVFTAVIWSREYASPLDDDGREVILVTKTAEGTMTAQRGRENTEAKDWSAGSMIANVLTADTLNSTAQHISAQDSLITVTDTEYTVSPADRNILFICPEEGFLITAALPEAALCPGVRFRFMNGTESYKGTVVITPNGTDYIRDTAGSVSLYAGSSLELVSAGTSWVLSSVSCGQGRDFSPELPAGGGMASAAYAFLGTGLGTADISAELLSAYVFVNVSDGMHGLPLTIRKADENPLALYVVTDTATLSGVTLYSKGDSVTLTTDISGGINILSVYRNPSERTVTVSDDTYLYGSEEYVLADASSGGFEIMLPYFATCAGQTVTVKKTDSSSETVTVSLYNPEDYEYSYLTAASPLTTFISDGSRWHRLV
ncbi:MAG: hypothetical protein AB7E96_01665 [Deferribacterales bacterium]